MAGNILKSDVTFVNAALPKLLKSSLINAGSLVLFDAAHPDAWAGGNPINGSVVHSLIPGGPDWTAKVGTLPITYDGKGFLMPSQPAAGAPGAWFSRTAPDLAGRNWVATAWVRARVDANTATNDQQSIFGIGDYPGAATRPGSQFALTLRAAGTSVILIGTVYDQGGTFRPVAYTRPSGALVDGELLQIGLSLEVIAGAGNVVLYVNGQPVGSYANSAITGTQAKTTLLAYIGAGGALSSPSKSRVYHGYIEDLTASGNRAAAVVAKDYATNLSRFQ